MTAAFALVGYWLMKHDFEPAPMLLGFVLGPLMEENLRRAMLIARGDWTVFLTRPISGALLAAVAILLVIAVLPMIRKRRDEVFVERLTFSTTIAHLISGGVFGETPPEHFGTLLDRAKVPEFDQNTIGNAHGRIL